MIPVMISENLRDSYNFTYITYVILEKTPNHIIFENYTFLFVMLPLAVTHKNRPWTSITGQKFLCPADNQTQVTVHPFGKSY